MDHRRRRGGREKIKFVDDRVDVCKMIEGNGISMHRNSYHDGSCGKF